MPALLFDIKTEEDRARTNSLLASRPAREPDHDIETLALHGLSSRLVSRPDEILKALSENTMALCGAGSAGVSLLVEEGSGDPAFYWPAITGAWARFVEGGLPRHASPCGRVLAADASLIFLDPADQFPAIIGVEPVIREVLLAPFHFEGRPVGTVWALAHDGDKPFDNEDRRRLESLAKFAATAYQSIKTAQSGSSPAQALPSPSERTTRALRPRGASARPTEPELDAITQLARTICDAPIAFMTRLEQDRHRMRARSGIDHEEMPINQSLCAHVIREPEVLVIPDLKPDLTKDDRAGETRSARENPPVRFCAGAALRGATGEPLGVLCVIADAPRPDGLSPEQSNSLTLLARQAAALIELRKAVGLRDLALVDQHRTASDVTERLKAAQDRLRSAQNAARVGTFEVDVVTDRIYVTEEFTRIFGLPKQPEFLAQDLMEMILPEDRVTASSPGRLADGSAPPTAEYRIRRGIDGALRWISRRGAFEYDAQGRPSRFLGMVEDVTERKLAEQLSTALFELGDRLRDASTKGEAVKLASALLGQTLHAMQAGYASIDPVAGLCTIEGGWAAPGATLPEGQFPFAVFPRTVERMRKGAPINVANLAATDWIADDLPTFRALGAAAIVVVPLLERGVLTGAVFVHSGIPRGWLAEDVEFVSEVADRLHGAVARLQASAEQRVLNQELGHRMKNTMAMVQSIAQQTLRGKVETEAMRDFDHRLALLGRAQDALMASSWVSARIGAVIDAAMSLHGAGNRVERQGPDLSLNARAALGLALLLHELTTNAVKYGALSNGTGHVSVAWSVVGHGEQAEFHLGWTESGGPEVIPPTRRGFGSRLLKAGLGGTRPAEIDYLPTGIVARFAAPLSRMTEQ